MELFRAVWLDFKVACHSIGTRPWLSSVAIVALAAGIAVSIPVLSYLDHAVLRGAVFQDPPSLALVQAISRDTGEEKGLTDAQVLGLESLDSVFNGVATFALAGLTTPDENEPTPVLWCFVSPNAFQVLGTAPIVGQLSETVLRERDVAIISYDYWARSHLRRAPTVLGQYLSRGWRKYRVVAVMPDGFRFPALGADVWIPFEPGGNFQNSAYAHVVARLKRGSDPVRVRQVAARALHDAGLPDGSDATIVPLTTALSAVARKALPLLALAALSAIFLASTVSWHLQLADAIGSRAEIGVRLALGASRLAAVRVFLFKGIIVSSAAEAIGLPLALVLVRIHNLSALDPSAIAAATVDTRVFTFVTVSCVCIGFLIGVIPGLITARYRLPSLLSAAQSGIVPRMSRASRILLATQVCFATAFLICAALAWRSMNALNQLWPGFSSNGILTVMVGSPQLLTMSTTETFKAERYFGQIIESSRSIPGVSVVAATNAVPIQAPMLRMPLRVPDGGPICTAVQFRVVSDEYFKLLGLGIHEGRPFLPSDGTPSSRVAIVNQTLERTCWSGKSPIGGTIGISRRSLRVVGVVGDVRTRGLRVPVVPEIYVPMTEMALPVMCVLMRVNGTDPYVVLPGFRRLVTTLDPEAHVVSARSIEDIMNGAEAPLSVRTTLLSAASIGTALVAILGLYAAGTHAVRQRKRDMAIRMALGAVPKHLIGGLTLDSLGWSVAGVAIGWGLAYWAASSLAPVLFDVKPFDLWTYVLAAGTMVLLSGISAWAGGRGVYDVELASALRSE